MIDAGLCSILTTFPSSPKPSPFNLADYETPIQPPRHLPFRKPNSSAVQFAASITYLIFMQHHRTLRWCSEIWW